MQNGPDDGGPLLELEGVGKSYGPQQILKGIQLRVMSGERVAIMGPSGSGKSTLLSCIAGLETPDQGRISFMGQDLTRLGEARLTELRRGTISSVFQFFHLLPTLRAWENVEFPLLLARMSQAERRERVDHLLEEVGLARRAQAWPSEMSGGEMQRLALARALITNPALVLADEPTGSLDSRNGERVLDMLSQLTRQHRSALLLVTHDSQAAGICSRILHMTDGILSEQQAVE